MDSDIGEESLKAALNPAESAVVAIVVAYWPVHAQIRRLIDVLAGECKLVLVMDNGGGRNAIGEALTSCATVRVVDMEGNRGIGAALNLGFELAKLAGVRYVATFDQDSEPPLGLTANLVRASERLTSGGARVGSVGPRIIDVRDAKRSDYPFMRNQLGLPRTFKCSGAFDQVEADFLITSGCLISLAVFAIVGRFDETLFVDYTDMEWCFRARTLGYRHYGICSVTMPHELGTGASARVLGVTILGHSPIRRYYYARNTVRLLKLPHVAVGWKARMLLGLLSRLLLLPMAVKFAKGWRKDWLMLFRGTADGIGSAGGACERPP